MDKIMPSDAQVETFGEFIKMSADAPANHQCKVQAEMDESGAMYVYLTEDEMTMFALFGRDGKMYGDWIV